MTTETHSYALYHSGAWIGRYYSIEDVEAARERLGQQYRIAIFYGEKLINDLSLFPERIATDAVITGWCYDCGCGLPGEGHSQCAACIERDKQDYADLQRERQVRADLAQEMLDEYHNECPRDDEPEFKTTRKILEDGRVQVSIERLFTGECTEWIESAEPEGDGGGPDPYYSPDSRHCYVCGGRYGGDQSCYCPWPGDTDADWVTRLIKPDSALANYDDPFQD